MFNTEKRQHLIPEVIRSIYNDDKAHVSCDNFDNIPKMASDKAERKPKKQISKGATQYLIAYNLIETVGWAIILYLLITYNLNQHNPQNLYETIKWPLIIFQNAAILEVVHAVIRIVPSNPYLTFIQVSSRVIVVCGVIIATNAARECFGLHLAVAAWSITEIIRYGNYVLSLLGGVPYFVSWLRYSTFIILYPVGVTGELLCCYAAQKETKIFTIELPVVNFLINYQRVMWIVMLLYIPLFPQLYLHMFSLRKKVLGKPQQKKVN